MELYERVITAISKDRLQKIQRELNLFYLVKQIRKLKTGL
jgi:hypothetical protein